MIIDLFSFHGVFLAQANLSGMIWFIPSKNVVQIPSYSSIVLLSSEGLLSDKFGNKADTHIFKQKIKNAINNVFRVNLFFQFLFKYSNFDLPGK